MSLQDRDHVRVSGVDARDPLAQAANGLFDDAEGLPRVLDQLAEGPRLGQIDHWVTVYQSSSVESSSIKDRTSERGVLPL